jgi:hypothetical protein
MLNYKNLLFIFLLIMSFDKRQAWSQEHAAAMPTIPGQAKDLLNPLVDVANAKRFLPFPPVSKERIQTDLQKNPGSRQHPRLIINAQDVARFRDLLARQDTFFQAGIEQLRREAEAYLNEPLHPYELDAANLRLTAPHATQIAISTLAFLYQVTGDTRYANKVKEHILHYSRFPDWNPQKHFLDTGIMAYAVALGYDWIYETLSPSERSEIIQSLMDKGLKPYLARTGSGSKTFWYQSPNNWNPICNGGLALAAMVLWDQSPTATELAVTTLERSFIALPSYIREFEPDGQSVEGLMYWGYGLTALIRWSESLKRTLGTDYGYSETPGLQRAGYFPISMSGPAWGVSVGDDPISSTERSGTFLWFSKRFDNPFLARYQVTEIQASQNYRMTDLLYYDPQLLLQGPENSGQPLDFYVHDMEYVSFRSSWDHQKALYVGIHGGDNKASHGHLDAGSFYIQGQGKVWALGGLGSDKYTYAGYFAETKPDYWDPVATPTSPGRFHFYRLRAEGKNTVVFNPDVRPDQNPYGKSNFTKIASTPEAALALLNLGPIYDRDAWRAERGVSLFHQRNAILIQDEFEAKHASDVYWSMHSLATIRLEHGERVAILEQDQEQLRVELKSPYNARFQVLPADYWPGLSFPLTENSENVFFGQLAKKLVIHLPDVERETIAVLFLPAYVPAEPGWPLKPLKNW